MKQTAGFCRRFFVRRKDICRMLGKMIDVVIDRPLGSAHPNDPQCIYLLNYLKIMKRVFLIVLDSFGIGEMEDAEAYGDKGTNTIGSVSTSKWFDIPNLKKMGQPFYSTISTNGSLIGLPHIYNSLKKWNFKN